MKLRLGPDDRLDDRKVISGVIAALVVGVGMYNVVPISSAKDDEAAPAVVATTTTTAPATAGASGDASGALPSGSGTFGSAVAALQTDSTADEVVASAHAIETVVSGPSCTTDVVTAAADDARARASAVLGVPVPGTGLADLAAIAAGCSNVDATGPVLSFALEVSALTAAVPAAAAPVAAAPVAAAPVAAAPAPAPAASSAAVTLPGAVAPATTEVSTTVATTVPAAPVASGLPAGLADALEQEADVIRAGCADVAYLGVAASVYPGGAVDFDGVPVAAAVARATALCALFGA